MQGKDLKSRVESEHEVQSAAGKLTSGWQTQCMPAGSFRGLQSMANRCRSHDILAAGESGAGCCTSSVRGCDGQQPDLVGG